jgi:hypothetical protein
VDELCELNNIAIFTILQNCTREVKEKIEKTHKADTTSQNDLDLLWRERKKEKESERESKRENERDR